MAQDNKPGIMDSLYHKTKNVFYSLKLYWSKTKSLKLANHSDFINILGKSFNIPEYSTPEDIEKTNEELISTISNICWFSYRRAFNTMVIEFEGKEYKLNSDAGWGCMIRSGQMMLYQTLRSIKSLENNDEENTEFLS